MSKLGFNRSGMLCKGATEPGWFHPAPDTCQKAHIKGFFKLPDRPGKCRLRHIQHPCGGGYTAMIDNGKEVEHLADIEISDV